MRRPSLNTATEFAEVIPALLVVAFFFFSILKIL